MLTVYGDIRSGNCLKVKWLLDRLGRDYRWVETDVLSGATRRADFLARNPAGQVPAVVLEDGRALAQSNAILGWLGEGTVYVPADAYDRARMYEWLFWEQYSHEPCIAVVRFQRLLGGKRPDEIEPRLMERGHAALARMEVALAQADWLVGAGPTLADLALVAYTRVAHEGDFDLTGYPAVRAWVARVEGAFGIS
ncbi:MAG: glutathione S-transferase family protein [Alphaproteobacteria bacterium]|uniref:glutathione S-transferase family protein n=1 Tax=Brevundimonas sp. TaxID=1871086 RepID=UPI0017971B4F|nr:glutathione S-transferase family protein [Brevundimonas sp.]MBA3048296.1 glutathione S-transferase family protein [Brevundimonas sp.]MBU3970487.1 glutathione S-transferase family protein [Alphaproteobacteria bacterium]MBU4137240.1 glutathione S-transferase family protein [Alphaproteobacteria bacterium]